MYLNILRIHKFIWELHQSSLINGFLLTYHRENNQKCENVLIKMTITVIHITKKN